MDTYRGYVKAPRKVAVAAGVADLRGMFPDGNYMLWERDLLGLKPYDLTALGCVAMSDSEARDEHAGLTTTVLPEPTDPRITGKEPEGSAADAHGEEAGGGNGNGGNGSAVGNGGNGAVGAAGGAGGAGGADGMAGEGAGASEWRGEGAPTPSGDAGSGDAGSGDADSEGTPGEGATGGDADGLAGGGARTPSEGDGEPVEGAEV